MVKKLTEKVIQVPAPQKQEVVIEIQGDELIFNKVRKDALDEMEAKHRGQPTLKSRARLPEKEYEDSFYYNSKGEICIPAIALKQSIVEAQRNLINSDLTMTLLRGVIFVDGGEEGLIPVTYKEKYMRRDHVRNSGIGRTMDLRFRGAVKNWSLKARIVFIGSILTKEQLINLVNYAGFSCGLLDWRPPCNGDKGTFKITGISSAKLVD